MRRYGAPARIALLTFTAFLPSLWNGFVDWDDSANLLENPHYRGLGWKNLYWMFTTFHLGPYQPLSWMSLGLDYLVWGMNPLGYHLTSLMLHAINGVLFYFVALRLLKEKLIGVRHQFPKKRGNWCLTPINFSVPLTAAALKLNQLTPAPAKTAHGKQARYVYRSAAI